MTQTQHGPVVANDRTYPWPKVTAIAICLDGCEPDYLTQAIAKGLMPTLKRMRETGTDRLAHSCRHRDRQGQAARPARGRAEV